MPLSSKLQENREKYIRPSTLRQISLCPGSPTMQAAVVLGYGEAQEADMARIGTVMHEICENAVNGWVLNLMSWDEALFRADVDALSHGLNKYDRWCVEYAIKEVAKLIDYYGIEKINVRTEQTIPMHKLGMDRTGSADVVLIMPMEFVVIIDYKFGFIDQGNPATHDQTAAYAAAASDVYMLPKVVCHLIQPRAEAEYRNPPAATYDAQALDHATRWTKATTDMCRTEDPKLFAGYEQCCYCRALGQCKQAENFIMKTLEAVALIGWPTDPNEAGEAVEAAKLAELRAEEVKELAKKHIAQGGEVTGFKLGSTRKTKMLTNQEEALLTLLDANIDVIDLVRNGALKLSVAKLTPENKDLIHGMITERTSPPSLIATKRK